MTVIDRKLAAEFEEESALSNNQLIFKEIGPRIKVYN